MQKILKVINQNCNSMNKTFEIKQILVIFVPSINNSQKSTKISNNCFFFFSKKPLLKLILLEGLFFCSLLLSVETAKASSVDLVKSISRIWMDENSLLPKWPLSFLLKEDLPTWNLFLKQNFHFKWFYNNLFFTT